MIYKTRLPEKNYKNTYIVASALEISNIDLQKLMKVLSSQCSKVMWELCWCPYLISTLSATHLQVVRKIQVFIACRRENGTLVLIPVFDLSTLASCPEKVQLFIVYYCVLLLCIKERHSCFDLSTLRKKSDCLLQAGVLKYLVTVTFLLWCLLLADPRS